MIFEILQTPPPILGPDLQAGTIHFTNGDRYEGEWSCGAKNGTGTYRCANGVVYEGRWKDDMRHGSVAPYRPSAATDQLLAPPVPPLPPPT